MPTDAGVAVVIPAFEAGATIDSALASVAGQTHRPREVVVVDDASTDDTAGRARQWEHILPLRVLRQEQNAGPAAARRLAIESSSAPLVALLDADDIWLPDHLDRLVHVHRSPSDIATADAYSWAPGARIASSTFRHRFPIPPPDEQMAAILGANFVFVGSLFSREQYRRTHGFRDGWSGAEDWDLWIQMIRSGARVRGTDAPTVLYRVASASLTATAGVRDAYTRVLERAVDEAATPAERDFASAAVGRARARSRLAAAHDAAVAGDAPALRAAARDAAQGGGRYRAEAVALRLFPRFTVRVTDALRARYWRDMSLRQSRS